MNDQLTAYKKTEILGKSQLDLIIQVYEGAIEAFKAARHAYEEEDNGTGHEQLERARRFVVHLYTTLDMEKGGEIADRLGRLYAFVINQTDMIEATKDLVGIDDNISILDNLRLGWLGLKEQEQNGKESALSDTGRDEKEVSTTA
jgi:flagellar protein FliS